MREDMGVIHRVDRGTSPPYFLYNNFINFTRPGGRVVSATNWLTRGLEFDSIQSQNFFFEGIKILKQYVAFRFELN